MNNLIERWVRPEIRALSAYHVADAEGLVKLDAMENPYAWPEELRDEWTSLLRATDVNRYPDPAARALAERLRSGFGIPGDAGLLMGNGSDEIIQLLALTVGGPGRVLLSVEPGFVMYRMTAVFTGTEYRAVSLRADDFSLDEQAVLEAVERYQPALLFLAYPNNPTGNLFDAAAIRRIIQASPGLVVVDEAYAPFTDESFLPRVLDYPNLLVMRTLSKMGLAGLRLGYIVGAADLIGELNKVRMPYNINVLTQAAAELALAHRSVLDQQTGLIRAERAVLSAQLRALPGLRVFDSQANFVLVRCPGGRAAELFDGIRRQGVLVKNLHGSHPLLAHCLRVTVGKPEENRAFMQALQSAL
jgi:histidinol-phosphate aminotransferase